MFFFKALQDKCHHGKLTMKNGVQAFANSIFELLSDSSS